MLSGICPYCLVCEEGSLHLQVLKESKLQILHTVRALGKTYILSLLTHLQPEISLKNGQIPSDSMTRPWHFGLGVFDPQGSKVKGQISPCSEGCRPKFFCMSEVMAGKVREKKFDL